MKVVSIVALCSIPLALPDGPAIILELRLNASLGIVSDESFDRRLNFVLQLPPFTSLNTIPFNMISTKLIETKQKIPNPFA